MRVFPFDKRNNACVSVRQEKQCVCFRLTGETMRVFPFDKRETTRVFPFDKRETTRVVPCGQRAVHQLHVSRHGVSVRLPDHLCRPRLRRLLAQVHCELKHKKTQSQSTIYQECVVVYLISGWMR
eukprot:3865061-Rhodomonas_salina.1